MTLATLDEKTGQLATLGRASHDGILPEAAVFDNSGNYLAVASYDRFDESCQGCSIGFWRIQADPPDRSNIQLVRTGHSVPVTGDVHAMAIAC